MVPAKFKKHFTSYRRTKTSQVSY